MLAVSPGVHTSRQRHLSLQERLGATSTMAATATSTVASAMPVSPHLVSGHVPAEALSPASSSSSSSASHPHVIQIHDRCHGEVTITEPPLVELLLSAPVQRLRHIQQHGITSLIGMTPSPVITRYEHSVGAMLLVRLAGGSVEAQAAALLHDIAHTALSHVVDGAFGYVVHEDDKMEYLHTTTIPSILQQHGLVPEHTLEEANFPLLELDAPAICADRLDYGIRDSLSFGFLTEHEARSISADLAAGPEGKFCFKSQQWAAVHSYAYMKSDEYAWSNPTHSLLYQRAADAIRVAHKSGHMEKGELWQKADEPFWQSMTQSPNSEVRRLALAVRPNVRVSQISAEEYEAMDDKEAFYKESAKIRTVDPDVLQSDGSIRRLTEVHPAYKAAREAYIARKSGPKYYAVTEA